MSLSLNLRLLSVVSIVLLTASCTASPKQLTILTSQIQEQRQDYGKPIGVAVQGIEFKVLTAAITLRMNRDVGDGVAPPYAYFALSEKDYLTLSQWLQDVLRYIREQNAIIAAYQRDTANHNKGIADDTE